MLTVWLVLISLSNPAAEPEFVAPFKTHEECAAAAIHHNDQSLSAAVRKPAPPKGTGFVCMKFVGST